MSDRTPVQTQPVDDTSVQPGQQQEAAALVGGQLAGRPASLAADAWRDLRRNPMFIIPAGIILIMMVMAIFPGLFTRTDPEACELSNSVVAPSGDAWFGYDIQGCDLYANVIYGARPSITIGLSVTVFAVIISVVLGSAAGYFGGITDTLISRFTDIFLGLPFMVGAIVFLTTVEDIKLFGYQFERGVFTVALILTLLGWMTMTRLMRSAVIGARDMDYVQAAKALGAGNRRVIVRHILPNAITPVVVYATVTIGTVIASEAALSFLGVGLQTPAISWGLQLNEARNRFLESPHLLIFPSAFLSVTVLAFILLGDALRDAFDPKLR